VTGSDGLRPTPGHRPRRALGQNFLVDRGIQARIVEAVPELDPAAGEGILEIGPGKGALTEGLAALGLPLLLVELDRVLAEAHRERWASAPHVRVLEADILDVALEAHVAHPERLVVVGNIPYNITTPILFHLLSRPRPAQILLMVQKEVGDRLLAPAGSRGYGALSVGVQSVARVEQVLQVPAGAFRPRPKVDSVVMRITPLRPEPLTLEEEGALRTLTRALFQWRRKQIGTTLRKHPDLEGAISGSGPGGAGREDATGILARVGVEPRSRPEVLPPATFVALARALLARGAPE
jgi:16S rRNA (adenine1518-N6/adenine1519-N6)-dimethyltransferase